MNAGRIILLGVALLAGGGAFYLVSSGEEAPEVIAQVVPSQPSVETVRVLVADEEIAKGATIDTKSLKWISWPKKNLQDYFITEDNREFYDKLPTAIARSTIHAGEPVIDAKVVYPGKAGMLSALLTPGMRAVTMDVEASLSAGGFILPGDHVDIYVNLENIEENRQTWSELLYSNIRVLAIDQQISDGDAAAIIGRTITLELAPSQVAGFANARAQNSLSLSLRSAFPSENEEELMQEAQPAEVIVIRYGQS